MANQRLINCVFIKDMEVSNKAKLLYFMFIVNGDDKGFVGNATKIIQTLNNNETNVDFVDTFDNALNELIAKGFLIVFKNNHGDYIYLIRHWFYHNKYYAKGWTNYMKFLKKVKLVENEYVLKKDSQDNEVVEDKELSMKDLLEELNENSGGDFH